MDILLYLTALLHTRKTIGIAGLGTLYKIKSPGRYDTSLHAFVPPSFKVAFTSEIKEDTELVNHISQQRNITTDAANYYIGEFAEKIQLALADHKEADLGTIGTLKVVDQEIILITPEENNFGTEFYGFPTLNELDQDAPVDNQLLAEETNTLAQIAEENQLEEENPGQETPAAIAEQPENDEQPTFEEIEEVSYPANTPVEDHSSPDPITPPSVLVEEKPKFTPPIYREEEEIDDDDDDDDRDDRERRIPFFVKCLGILFLILAAGAVAYFFNPGFFDRYIGQNFEGKNSEPMPIEVNDTLNQPIDSLANDTAFQNNGAAVQPQNSNAIDSSKVTIYEVLGAAESTEAKADAYIARVATKGIKAKRIKLSKRLINISLGTFIDQKEAIQYQDSLRILLKNPDIYIKSFKPQN